MSLNTKLVLCISGDFVLYSVITYLLGLGVYSVLIGVAVVAAEITIARYKGLI